MSEHVERIQQLLAALNHELAIHGNAAEERRWITAHGPGFSLDIPLKSDTVFGLASRGV